MASGIYVIVFIFGLIFGSFTNVLVLRFQTGESLVTRGSRCFSCSRRLEWFELLPIFSYIVLRGKCRSCKSRISIQYPLVEFGTGILFLLLFWKFLALYSLGGGGGIGNFGIAYVLFLLAAWYTLWLASLYDLRHMILPDRFLAFALFFSIAAFILNYALPVLRSAPLDGLYQFAAGILAFLFFFTLWFISRGRWIGLGDAKFAFILGTLLGPVMLLLSIILSFFIGTIFSFGLLAFGKARMKTKIPFGPFLFLGGLASFLSGSAILESYLGLFL